MSEKLRQHHEKHEAGSHEIRRHQEALKDAIEKKAERASHEHAENIAEIRSTIEAAAKAKHEQDEHSRKHEKRENVQPTFINGELKDMAYRRTLKRVQNKLPAPARAFSKVVHNRGVEAVSEVVGKTVARPSGILSGGIFAFLGSSLLLWIARHYGYEYNYFVLVLIFIGGFFVGLLVEMGLRLANRRSR